MPKLGEAFVIIRARLGPLKAGLRAARSVVVASMRTINNTIRKLGAITRRYARRLTIAIGGAITASVYAFVKFEEQLANVSTMLDDHTMHYMPQYAKALKLMAVEFGEGTKTMSRGLYDILSASIPPAQAMDVLRISVIAAKAGMTETGIAADAITTILNSYGLSADRAGEVSDKLFAIVKRGKITFGQLAPSIGKVAALANVAGISFEELGAAIATMTRAGLQADVTMTAMKGIVRAFLKPTTDATAMAKKFGVELSSTTLKAEGLVSVLMKLKDATAEQLAVIMPNVRGMAGFAAALKQADKQADDLRLMLNSAGLTQKAFNKMTGTLKFNLDRLKQAFIVLASTIGETLAPAIKKLTKTTIQLTKKLTDTIDTNRKKIRDWALKTVAIMTFVKNIMWSFVKFMKTDWRDGLKFAFDAALIQFEAFGKSLFDLFKKIFQDIALNTRTWIEEAFARRKAIKTIANEIYKDLYEKEFGAKGGLPLISPRESATVEGRKRANVLRRIAIARAERRVGELGEEYTPAVKKEITTWAQLQKRFMKYQKDALAKIEKSMPKDLKDAWSGHFRNLKDRLAEIDEKYAQVAEQVGEFATETVQRVSETVAKTIKDIGVTTKGPVGFMGFREAWGRMAESFSRTKEDIQKRMLDEQQEANLHLRAIEANTELLREVGKATD